VADKEEDEDWGGGEDREGREDREGAEDGKEGDQQQQQQQQQRRKHEANPPQTVDEEAILESPLRGQMGCVVNLSPGGNNSPTDSDGGDVETVRDREGFRDFWGSAVEQVVGKRVFLDSTAPVDRLEDLRGLVAEQAQAAARVTMTAVGTDGSKGEATRIRYGTPKI